MSTEVIASLMGANDELAQAIEQACIKWEIISTLEKCHFLAQTSVETQRFTMLRESMNYSVAGLRATFGKHRITDEQCARYGRTATRPANQEAIANIVYGGEWGARNLGNIYPGDGWRFIGRGLIHLTGRANVEKYFDGPPAWLEQPWVAADSAGWFWKTKGCDVYARADDIVGLTRRVNGGTNGLAERRVQFAKAQTFFQAITHAPK